MNRPCATDDEREELGLMLILCKADNF